MPFSIRRGVGSYLLVLVAAVWATCAEAADVAAEAAEGPVELPAAAEVGAMSVEETIAARRSIRAFKPDELSAERISQLLWSAQGITEPGRGLRAAPSAGATYPLELYVAKADGVFKYVPKGHLLRRVSEADVRKKLSAACYGQRWVAQAPVSFVITAVYERTSRRYGDRATRYVDIEAGCAAENLALQCVALDLGTVIVGAFTDAEVAELVGCAEGETPLMVLPVGVPAK